MLFWNGRHFSTVAWSNGTPAYFQSAAYGGRTVIEKTGAVTYAWVTVEPSVTCKIFGTASESSAANPRAWHCSIQFAFETLSLDIGHDLDVFDVTAVGTPSGDGGDIYNLCVKNEAGTHNLYFTSVGLNDHSQLIAAVTAGTTFHRVDFYAYLDKVSIYYDDVFVADVTFSASRNNSYIWRVGIQSSDDVDFKLDSMTLTLEEVSFTSTLDRVLTNYHPDDGKLYVISKAGINTLIGSGEAYELDVTDGDIAAESCTNTKDYLLAFVDSTNNYGGTAKMNKSSGDEWSKSNWSLV